MSQPDSTRATPALSRRAWLAAAATLGVALLADATPAGAALLASPGGKHPDPRPGIDASRFPDDAKVRVHGEKAVAAYDDARRIPEVLDGIRCQCGCAGDESMRSLLSCYEGDGAMALECPICQGEGRLAWKLHHEGKSLAEIRAAIERRYGS